MDEDDKEIDTGIECDTCGTSLDPDSRGFTCKACEEAFEPELKCDTCGRPFRPNLSNDDCDRCESSGLVEQVFSPSLKMGSPSLLQCLESAQALLRAYYLR